MAARGTSNRRRAGVRSAKTTFGRWQKTTKFHARTASADASLSLAKDLKHGLISEISGYDDDYERKQSAADRGLKERSDGPRLCSAKDRVRGRSLEVVNVRFRFSFSHIDTLRSAESKAIRTRIP
jgi:hypothetical protein